MTEPQERLFFKGYGAFSIDQVVLAYYRYAWAISDIGSYGEQSSSARISAPSIVRRR